jgi:hypothetical protein
MKPSSLFTAIITLALSSALAQAEYLVGVQVYASGTSGQNIGAYSGTYYQFSTNSNTLQDGLTVNGTSSAISFKLSNGPNVFNFSPGVSQFSIDSIGLNLFFNETGTSFNPPYVANVGIPGDLSAYVTAGKSPFAIPAAGTDVQSYNSSNLDVNSTSYSGATSFVEGNERITLTSFTAATDPSGTFTLTMTPTPEPGMLAVLGIGLALLALAVRRQ